MGLLPKPHSHVMIVQLKEVTIKVSGVTTKAPNPIVPPKLRFDIVGVQGKRRARVRRIVACHLFMRVYDCNHDTVLPGPCNLYWFVKNELDSPKPQHP